MSTDDKPYVIARAKTSDGRTVALWSHGPLTGAMGLALPGVPLVRPRGADALAVALAAGRCVVDAAPALALAEVPAHYAAARREAARPVAEIVTAAPTEPPSMPDVTVLVASLNARRKALTFVAERLGWEVISVEIDLVAQTARVEARRGARLVMLDVRHGRAVVERFDCGETTRPVGRRGDRFSARVLTREFLGRSKHTNPREALATLAGYLVDNGNGEALDAGALLALSSATEGE